MRATRFFRPKFTSIAWGRAKKLRKNKSVIAREAHRAREYWVFGARRTRADARIIDDRAPDAADFGGCEFVRHSLIYQVVKNERWASLNSAYDVMQRGKT